MPSRKKKSKAKGRKPAAGEGGMKAEENVTANVEQKGTLNSEMQRLKIGEQQGDDDDALLEEAIKLAAVEKQEIEEKEKENCTHGYNPSSKFQARYCEDLLKTFKESYYASTRGSRYADRLNSAFDAFDNAFNNAMSMSTSAKQRKSDAKYANPCCLAEGTKFILDGKSDDARVCAILTIFVKSTIDPERELVPDRQKLLELLGDIDEHTLVQFFRKQIPCSCLDEKYKEVKSIPKMGICYNDNCPLPGHMAVRSKMMRCIRCRNINYCSRECQEADWPHHKDDCGKSDQELAAIHSKK
jgi:hypothetical protein